MTIDQLMDGCRFADGICQATFNVDIHAMKGDTQSGRGLETRKVPMYEIPHGCLVPRQRRGLLVAGRCISGDHIAHASYRVTGNAAALGEAAGVAAAMAASGGSDPSELDGAQVRAALERYYRSLPHA